MNTTVHFFPVDNGDMTLVKLPDTNNTSLLIDCNIRETADNPNEATPDVAKALRGLIETDSYGRPYVDAFLWSHPDQDHCRGVQKHFWLGAIDDYPDDDKIQGEKRIVIRQIWSSPMVFRRADKRTGHTLSDDAKALNKEAKRRVKAYKKNGSGIKDGDKIFILGEDENGQTDNLEGILVRRGDVISGVNDCATDYLEARLLAPFKKDEDDVEDELTKNNSSVVMRFTLRNRPYATPGFFLAGGDAGVYIWEKIWSEYDESELEYDLLLTPHHCSWRSLSYDSWSDCREEAELSSDARDALGQAKAGAMLVASSKPISDEDADPPCSRAKREYKAIVAECDGSFKCTGETPSKTHPKPIKIEWQGSCFVMAVAASASASVAASAPPRAGKYEC